MLSYCTYEYINQTFVLSYCTYEYINQTLMLSYCTYEYINQTLMLSLMYLWMNQSNVNAFLLYLWINQSNVDAFFTVSFYQSNKRLFFRTKGTYEYPGLLGRRGVGADKVRPVWPTQLQHVLPVFVKRIQIVPIWKIQCRGAGAATFRVEPEPIFFLAGADFFFGRSWLF